MAILLYRQVQDWERAGLKMNRATLANWILAVRRDYFAPLWKHLKTELLKSSVIHCDETTVQVLKEPGKTPTSESYMWAYRSGEHEENQIVLFDYQPGRSGDYAKKFLERYEVYFVTDGYAGYNKVTDGIRCDCWAYVRRKFLEAIPGSDPNGEQAKGSKAKALSSAKNCSCWSVNLPDFLRQNGRQNVKNEADPCWKNSGYGAAALTRCGIHR